MCPLSRTPPPRTGLRAKGCGLPPPSSLLPPFSVKLLNLVATRISQQLGTEVFNQQTWGRPMGVAVGLVFACLSGPRDPALLKCHLSWGLLSSEAGEQTSFLSEFADCSREALPRRPQ